MTHIIYPSAPQINLNATNAVTLLLSTLMIIVREPDSFEGKKSFNPVSQLLFFNMSAQNFSYGKSSSTQMRCEYTTHVCRLRFKENFSTDYRSRPTVSGISMNETAARE